MGIVRHKSRLGHTTGISARYSMNIQDYFLNFFSCAPVTAWLTDSIESFFKKEPIIDAMGRHCFEYHISSQSNFIEYQ